MTTTETHPLRAKADAFAAGLRELADLIEREPDFAEFNCSVPFNLYVWRDKARFIDLAHRLGGNRSKDARGEYMRVSRRFGPLHAQVVTDRAQVCERVVIGTETVEVPDPSATVPTVTVEREVVKWKCAPIFDDLDDAA